MVNDCVFVFLGILTVTPIFGIVIDLQLQSPVIKLYKVDNIKNSVIPYDRELFNELPKVIVEDVVHLRLECKAYYPVQLIDIGNGVSKIIF